MSGENKMVEIREREDVPVSRKRRIWPVFLVVALIVLGPPVGLYVWASLNHYGVEPSYRVDSYDGLKGDLARDCPDIRFPDLSRYEGLPGFEYKVRYDGGRITMRNRCYSISYRSAGDEGMAGDAENSAVDTSLIGFSVSSSDRRSFDGHSRAVPAIEANMELEGVEVQRSQGIYERKVENGFYGRQSYSFELGGYFYYVSGTYDTAKDGGAREADMAQQELLEIAQSIIRSEA